MTPDQILTFLFRITIILLVWGTIIAVRHNRKIYIADMKAKNLKLSEMQRLMNDKLFYSLNEVKKLLTVLVEKGQKKDNID